MTLMLSRWLGVGMMAWKAIHSPPGGGGTYNCVMIMLLCPEKIAVLIQNFEGLVMFYRCHRFIILQFHVQGSPDISNHMNKMNFPTLKKFILNPQKQQKFHFLKICMSTENS